MKFHRRSIQLSFLLLVISLISISCMQREEKIAIAEDGTATIVASFRGNQDDFAPPVALPSDKVWHVLQSRIDSNSTGGDDEVVYEAELTVPYGKALPDSYADSATENYQINLRFPTQIRKWTENGRTFYEFRRTYLARDFLTFNLSESEFWDKDLEDKIIKEGIFNVSEEEREQYLDQYGMGYGYFNLQLFSKTLGELVRQGDASAAVKVKLEREAQTYLEDVVRPIRLLSIMGKPEDSIGTALSQLESEIQTHLLSLLSKEIGAERTAVYDKCLSIFRRFQQEYAITQSLGSNGFSITVAMPGTIIKTNGLTEFEESGKVEKVEWRFTGKDLHDSDKSLYALSIVEK